jgi:cation diffusion facilitator family transporter
VIGTIKAILHIGHSHDHGELATDKAFSDNKLGIRTVWLALLALGLTSIMQIFIVILSGSVALFADTVHNVGDALNSIPLLIAFYLARRLANRRYTFGYARAEDVAGIFIVLSIAFSAAVVIWESIQRLLNPQPITDLGWVAAAAVIGFVGNEIVALLQIRVGKRIGSAALVADGLHAQIDGLTSLSVLIAVFGTAIGFPILDPIIGLLIGIAILFIVKDATVRMWYRLMDAIEPELMDQAEAVIKTQRDIREFRRLRMRWMGHRLQAEVYIAVDADLTTAEGHDIGERIRYNLFHELPRLSDVVVHVDPWPESPEEHHRLTSEYEPIPETL